MMRSAGPHDFTQHALVVVDDHGEDGTFYLVIGPFGDMPPEQWEATLAKHRRDWPGARVMQAVLRTPAEEDLSPVRSVPDCGEPLDDLGTEGANGKTGMTGGVGPTIPRERLIEILELAEAVRGDGVAQGEIDRLRGEKP